MIRKMILWVIAYSFGIFTIQMFSVLVNGDISIFISELIMNPLKFFIGMILFTITILAFSSFITSLIEKNVNWIKRKSIPELSIILDYSIVFCYYLLFQKSRWVTVCFLIFSIIYGIISVNLDNEKQNEVN